MFVSNGISKSHRMKKKTTWAKDLFWASSSSVWLDTGAINSKCPHLERGTIEEKRYTAMPWSHGVMDHEQSEIELTLDRICHKVMKIFGTWCDQYNNKKFLSCVPRDMGADKMIAPFTSGVIPSSDHDLPFTLKNHIKLGYWTVTIAESVWMTLEFYSLTMLRFYIWSWCGHIFDGFLFDAHFWRIALLVKRAAHLLWPECPFRIVWN